ncbi:MAG: DUF3379 family protein [Gammaproteobacteria bacterium]|nr:DUF3379 family protein [Gammaproteobacteria bacterium]
MNCLEFRQHYLADPRSQDSAYLEHKHACRACGEFAAQEATFEQALRGALAVDVPHGLTARVILSQTLHQARRRRTFVAVAAAVLLAIPAAAVLLRPLTTSLEQEVIAHIAGEREHLAAHGPVPDSAVTAVLATIGVDARQPLTDVRYAGVCPIRRQPGGHLVLAGAHGPVTVLLMPREPVRRRRPIATAEFQGVILPAGDGSVAIVGAPGEALETIEQQLDRALRGLS